MLGEADERLRPGFINMEHLGKWRFVLTRSVIWPDDCRPQCWMAPTQLAALLGSLLPCLTLTYVDARA
eukprot:1148571-Pelagomonas_calceolata.AAC.3